MRQKKNEEAEQEKEANTTEKAPKKKSEFDLSGTKLDQDSFSRLKESLSSSKEKRIEVNLSNTDLSFEQLCELSFVIKDHTNKIERVILTGNRFLNLEGGFSKKAKQIKLNLKESETIITIKHILRKELVRFFDKIDCVKHGGKLGAKSGPKKDPILFSDKKDEKLEKEDKIDPKNEQSSSVLSKVDSSKSSNQISKSTFLKSIKAKLSPYLDVMTNEASGLKEQLKSIEVSQILLGKLKNTLLDITGNDLTISAMGSNGDVDD